jgi:multiple sugar transport system permease protein
MVLTGGGPARTTEVLTLSAYKQVFAFFNLGRGSAVAVVLLFCNLCMAFLYYKAIISDGAGNRRKQK